MAAIELISYRASLILIAEKLTISLRKFRFELIRDNIVVNDGWNKKRLTAYVRDYFSDIGKLENRHRHALEQAVRSMDWIWSSPDYKSAGQPALHESLAVLTSQFRDKVMSPIFSAWKALKTSGINGSPATIIGHITTVRMSIDGLIDDFDKLIVDQKSKLSMGPERNWLIRFLKSTSLATQCVAFLGPAATIAVCLIPYFLDKGQRQSDYALQHGYRLALATNAVKRLYDTNCVAEARKQNQGVLLNLLLRENNGTHSKDAADLDWTEVVYDLDHKFHCATNSGDAFRALEHMQYTLSNDWEYSNRLWDHDILQLVHFDNTVNR